MSKEDGPEKRLGRCRIYWDVSSEARTKKRDEGFLHFMTLNLLPWKMRARTVSFFSLLSLSHTDAHTHVSVPDTPDRTGDPENRGSYVRASVRLM